MTATYDTIVVGAGSSGCVIAARLSEDPERKVLLLEAGGSDRTTICKKPGMLSIIHTVPQVKARFDWGFKTAPQGSALDRKLQYPRGKVLGGSSAINGMLWVRGNRANYDQWANDGCPGWSYDEVLPSFRRIEDYEGGEDQWRGTGGPIKVSRATDISPVSAAFQHAFEGATGAPLNDDYNGESQEGSGPVQQSCASGLRYSTSEGYLHPAMKRPNLTVITRALTHNVIIENGRAIGVKYEVGGNVVEARATDVVLSAGAVGSPQVLMRSGIGPAAHLAELCVDVVADLPVGENLHDHLFFPIVFLTPEAGHRGTPAHFLGGMLKEYLFGGTWFARTVFEIIGFVNSGLGSAIPDLQFHTLPWAYPAPNQDGGGRPVVDLRPALTVQPTLIYPKSRGTVRLTSADPGAIPIIDPGFLTDPHDAKVLLRGIEMAREIMNHPSISSMVTGELEPGGDYTEERILAELPNRIATVYHPVGTCRMGTDDRAVVDPELKVRGVEGLRVADASVIPSITGGNTNAPAVMIGERCAELMR